MFYLGDFKAGSVITLQFITSDADGHNVSWDTWGATRVYRGIETDNIITDTSDAITNFEDILDDGGSPSLGHQAIEIDTSEEPSFFAAGFDYHISVGGSVDSTNVRAVVGMFSIENRSLQEIKGTGFDSATDSLNDIRDAISTENPPRLED